MRRRKDLDPLRAPKAGSDLRRIYDLFLTGGVVTFARMATIASTTQIHRAVSDLRDYYNCEIVHPVRGEWRLTGRWDGPIFLSVEKLAALDMADHATVG